VILTGAMRTGNSDGRRMDWMYWPWTPTNWFIPPVAQPIRGGPSTGDLWVIQALCELVAGESLCTRCGSPLGRQVVLVSAADGLGTGWSVRVATRCSGWRRHNKRATVVESTHDQVFFSFRG
jgi:hypothetical protein